MSGLPASEGGAAAPRARGRRGSLIFRYLLLYTALFALLVAVVLGLVYRATVAWHEDAADRAVAAEASRLHGALQGRTETQMAAVVTQSTNAQGGRTTIYLLATERREYVAGNLPAWPGGVEEGATDGEHDDHPELQEFPLAPGAPAPGAPAAAGAAGAAGAVPAHGRARGRAIALPSGYRLLVARNVTEAHELRDLVTVWLLGALGLTVVLGIGGGFVLARRLSARLDDLGRNSRAILDGDLHRRMPVSPRGDEFDALAASLNQMLDRIEDLMDGMRHVSESIAHDMRSPLSRLRSRIEVALMQPPDGAAYRGVLEHTLRDIDAVLGMFNALLTIALAESGAPRERFVAVDLRALAADAVEIYEPAAEERGLRLTLDADEPVAVRGEPQLLAQALANLLDNAVKYVAAPGSVVVRLRGDAGGATLEVADDGPGVPEEFRARAFERFSRVEQSRTTPGSGLGLSLVRAVARLHGGEVTLAAGGPGLAVRIRLPRS